MELLQWLRSSFLQTIVKGLHGVTILIVLWGAVLAVKEFLLLFFRKQQEDTPRLERLNSIKNTLGGYVLLGLEILIIADIVDSITQPNLQDIARLGAIVLIRTVISVFLNKEIRSEDQRYD